MSRITDRIDRADRRHRPALYRVNGHWHVIRPLYYSPPGANAAARRWAMERNR